MGWSTDFQNMQKYQRIFIYQYSGWCTSSWCKYSRMWEKSQNSSQRRRSWWSIIFFILPPEVPFFGTSGGGTKKTRPLFNANIPPKWCRTRLFYAFIIFGWVLSQFSKIAHFLSFLRRFYCYMGEKIKLPWYQGRWPQIKKVQENKLALKFKFT